MMADSQGGHPERENDKLWRPKRKLLTKDKEYLKTLLIERNGQKCMFCGAHADRASLELDHINENTHDNKLENLRLVHHACNAKAYHANRRARKTGLSYPCVSERKSDGMPSSSPESVHGDGTLIAKETVDYSEGSPEMQVNDFAETAYRNWSIAMLRQRRLMLKKELVNAGAEEVGVSPVTTRRYLDKLTSIKGSLKEFKQGGQTFVKLKQEEQEGDFIQ